VSGAPVYDEHTSRTSHGSVLTESVKETSEVPPAVLDLLVSRRWVSEGSENGHLYGRDIVGESGRVVGGCMSY
jgi:hypothetical protein